jgi:hypothetical protein
MADAAAKLAVAVSGFLLIVLESLSLVEGGYLPDGGVS